MTYLDNAPPVLIRMHMERTPSFERKPNGSERGERGKKERSLSASKLLEIMLCNELMGKAWRIISKSLVSEQDYQKFYSATLEAMRLARRGIVNQKDRKARYEDVAKRAEKLAKLIAEPRNVSGSNRLYAGDLDLRVYELLPADVAILLGAKSWPTMKADQRCIWAHSVLYEWPTMVELLQQLAIRARLQGSVPVSSGRRSRLRPGEGDRARETKTKARLFACHLYDHLRSVDDNFTGFDAIRRIVKAVYLVDFSNTILRTVVRGPRVKTTS